MSRSSLEALQRDKPTWSNVARLWLAWTVASGVIGSVYGIVIMLDARSLSALTSRVLAWSLLLVLAMWQSVVVLKQWPNRAWWVISQAIGLAIALEAHWDFLGAIGLASFGQTISLARERVPVIPWMLVAICNSVAHLSESLLGLGRIFAARLHSTIPWTSSMVGMDFAFLMEFILKSILSGLVLAVSVDLSPHQRKNSPTGERVE